MTRASNEFAQTFDSINKIFSRSLDSAEDRNTRIIRTNLHCEILKLKQEQGKNILLGGVSVPSQLIALGLVDEYRFVVGPTVAGEGLAIGTQQALENQYDLVAGPDTYRIDDCLACLFEAIPVPMRWHKFFGHTFRFLEAFLHLPAGVALRDPA